MGSTPQELKSEIDRKREDLAANVDALADRVNPAHAARRGASRMSSSAVAVKDRVMGSASDAGTSLSDKASTLGGKASSLAGTGRYAPHAVKARAQGNPLAAGIVAFGLGMLVAAVLPATAAEESAVTELGELTEPLRDSLTEAAHEVQESLTQSAKDSAHEVADTVGDAVEATKSAAKDGASEVGGSAGDARAATQERALDAVAATKQA